MEAAFKDELAKLLKDGFAANESRGSQKSFMDQRVIGRSQDAGLARQLATNAQYGWTMQRQAEFEQKIAALTPAQINATVRKYVDPAQISYFKAGDFKKAGITK